MMYTLDFGGQEVTASSCLIVAIVAQTRTAAGVTTVFHAKLVTLVKNQSAMATILKNLANL
jgi:hypothetical protein